MNRTFLLETPDFTMDSANSPVDLPTRNLIPSITARTPRYSELTSMFVERKVRSLSLDFRGSSNRALFSPTALAPIAL